MKLIVEVPKDEYEECKMQVEMIRKEGVLVESLSLASKIHIANGTPLDDIRQEIENLEYSWYEVPYENVIDDVLAIIDKHISGKELKQELK